MIVAILYFGSGAGGRFFVRQRISLGNADDRRIAGIL